MNVRRKLLTMVDTPTFAAIANSNAASASDRPGNCCRVSAQNHCARTPRDSLSAIASTRSRISGSASAAPISIDPSRAKPATSPCAVSASAPAATSRTSASAPCTRADRPAAMLSARGEPPASSGRRASRQNAAAEAMAVPPNAIARPDAHQTGRNCSVPATVAPYRPCNVAATSGNSSDAMT